MKYIATIRTIGAGYSVLPYPLTRLASSSQALLGNAGLEALLPCGEARASHGRRPGVSPLEGSEGRCDGDIAGVGGARLADRTLERSVRSSVGGGTAAEGRRGPRAELAAHEGDKVRRVRTRRPDSRAIGGRQDRVGRISSSTASPVQTGGTFKRKRREAPALGRLLRPGLR